MYFAGPGPAKRLFAFQNLQLATTQKNWFCSEHSKNYLKQLDHDLEKKRKNQKTMTRASFILAISNLPPPSPRRKLEPCESRDFVTPLFRGSLQGPTIFLFLDLLALQPRSPSSSTFKMAESAETLAHPQAGKANSITPKRKVPETTSSTINFTSRNPPWTYLKLQL